MKKSHYGLPDDTIRADSVRLGVCDDMHVHVTLLDAKGTPFADACIGGVAEAADFRDSLLRALDDIKRWN